MTAPDPPAVLVIEDERDLATVYERWLGDRYDVRLAYDGDTALEMLDSTVEVVLLDRVMPGLSGDDVLDRIREERLDCRVAVVSAVEPGFDVVEMGFDEYLVKPVGGDELLATVEKLLTRNEYTGRMQEYFSLVSKKGLLDASKTRAERDESERYAELCARIDELEAEVEELRTDILDADDAVVAFRDLAQTSGGD